MRKPLINKFGFLFKLLCILFLLSGCASEVNSSSEAMATHSLRTDMDLISSGVSIPIRSRVVAGSRFFYVRMRIGDGPETNVILDTGSVGLRAIAAVVRNSNDTGIQTTYNFESGNELVGSVSTASVSAGQLNLGTIPIQVVDRLRCVQKLPKCPASRLDPSSPFAQGIDGRSNQEFGAILGVRLMYRKNLTVPNPLTSAGFKRWVVQLPRSKGELGSLVLDPTEKQLSDFAKMKVANDGTIAGCLDTRGVTQYVCLPTLLDSGDPYLFVYLPSSESRVLPPGIDVKELFSDTGSDASKVVFGFSSAKKYKKQGQGNSPYNPALVFNVKSRWITKSYINTGYLPFFNYSILFDNEGHTIGMLSRTRR